MTSKNGFHDDVYTYSAQRNVNWSFKKDRFVSYENAFNSTLAFCLTSQFFQSYSILDPQKNCWELLEQETLRTKCLPVAQQTALKH